MQIEEIKSDKGGAALFRNSLIAAKASSDRGHFVVTRELEDYLGQKLFGVYDRARANLVAGGAVIDGEIASIFKNFHTARENGVTGEVLPLLLDVLIKNGGEMIVCQEGLVDTYNKYKFRKIATAKPIDKTEPEKYYLLLVEKGLADATQNFTDYKQAKKFTKQIMARNKLGRAIDER